VSRKSLYSFQISSSSGALPGVGTIAVVAIVAEKLPAPELLDPDICENFLVGKVKNSSCVNGTKRSLVSGAAAGALAGFADRCSPLRSRKLTRKRAREGLWRWLVESVTFRNHPWYAPNLLQPWYSGLRRL